MSDGDRSTTRPRRRLARAALLVLVVLAVLAFGLYRFVSDPVRLAAYAEGLLEDMTGADATIGSVEFSFDGRIDVRDVKLRVAGLAGEGGEVLSMRQVVLHIDPWQAIRTRLVTREMILIEPVLSLTEVGEGNFNYEYLREARMRGLDESDGPPELPWVVVRQGRMRFGEYNLGEYKLLGDVGLEGQLSPQAETPSEYRFVLSQEMPHGADAAADDKGPSLSGSFDLKTLRVEAEVTGFAFADPHRSVLPRKIRAWWDRLEPSGSLPMVRFSYDAETGPTGVLELAGISLTVPMVEEGYRPRMTEVSGRFLFEADRIVIERLEGRIEGVVYSVEGRVMGYSADSAFNLAVRTRPFRIPEEPRYMAAMPLAAQKVFQMLTPVGWMRVSLTVQRAEAGGEIDYRGVSTILSGRELYRELDERQIAELAGAGGRLDPSDPVLVSHGMYHKFEYPLRNCRGMIRFNPQGIVVEQLTGATPGGGTATITGTIGPLNESPGVDLTITAVDIPFDETLQRALPPSSRRGFEAFYNKAEYERLRGAGHLVSSADRAQDEARLRELQLAAAAVDDAENLDEKHKTLREAALTAEISAMRPRLALPVYDLGGRGKAIIGVTRPVGQERVTLHTMVDLGGTNVVFEWFAYPIHVMGGRVSIVGDSIVFENVEASGLAGGVGSLNGRIDLVRVDGRGTDDEEDDGKGGSERKLVPDLRLVAAGLPLNDLMYDVLPSRRSDVIRRLGLTGSYNIDGRILRNERDKIDIDLMVTLADASSRPGGGPITFDSVEGALRIALDRTELLGITATASTGERLEIRGEIDGTDPARPMSQLTAEAMGLRFEHGIIDLISPVVEDVTPLAEFWAKHEPAGEFAASARFGSVGEAESYRIELRPRSLSFLKDGHRVSLRETSGTVAIEPGLVTLAGFAGDFDGCAFEASGTIALGAEPVAELSLRASGAGITEPVRRALPEVVRSMLDALKLQGEFDLSMPRLVVRPTAGGARAVDLEGQVRLTGASLEAGLAVSRFDGNVGLIVRSAPSAGEKRVEIDVTGDRLRALNRDFESLTLRLVGEDSLDHLSMPLLRARTSGGTLEGIGSIELDTGEYQIESVLTDATLGRLMTRADGTAGGEAMDGQLSASLAIEGNFRRDEQPRGRGDVQIRDASLPGLPLALGLLNMTHLNLPVTESFKRARLGYYLRDGQFFFEVIQLDSPTLRVEGMGRLDYASGRVDFTLKTSNPGGLKLGPLTTLIDNLRDQLVTIRVTGTTEKPEVSVRQLEGINRAVEDVLGNGQDGR